MRDLLTVIIVVLIIAILADGVRRMRLARRDKIRISPNVYKSKSGARDEATDNDLYTSELPNGGARVVAQRSVPPSTPKSFKFPGREQRKPEQTSLNLDTAVPMLMESVEDVLFKDASTTNKHAATTNDVAPARTERHDVDYGDGRIEPRIEPRVEPRFEPRTEPTITSATAIDDVDDTYAATGSAGNAYLEDDDYQEDEYDADGYDENENDDYDDELEAVDDEQDDYDDDEYYQEDEDDTYTEDDPLFTDDDSYEPVAATTPAASSARTQVVEEPEEVLIINVMASRGNNFRGDALLDLLLKCGLRYGDMNIFHRYSDMKGEGALLFSLANMVKPGTFDLDTMEDFETPGVSLFMTLPIKADSMQSFELMVDTAQVLAEELNGELKDEQRSVMTRQTIDHCRERIRDFERRRLFSRRR
jgi:cell division protein ZipA